MQMKVCFGRDLTVWLFRTSKKKVQTLLLQMDNKIIDNVLDFNFLGILFNEQLNWKSHIDKLSVKCCRILGIGSKEYYP